MTPQQSFSIQQFFSKYNGKYSIDHSGLLVLNSVYEDINQFAKIRNSDSPSRRSGYEFDSERTISLQFRKQTIRKNKTSQAVFTSSINQSNEGNGCRSHQSRLARQSKIKLESCDHSRESKKPEKAEQQNWLQWGRFIQKWSIFSTNKNQLQKNSLRIILYSRRGLQSENSCGGEVL